MNSHRISCFGLEGAQSWLPILILRVADLQVNKRRLDVLSGVNLADPVLQSHREMIRGGIGVNHRSISASADELDWKCFIHDAFFDRRRAIFFSSPRTFSAIPC
jgi:hypothetical protein